MYLGNMVELGNADKVFFEPSHPYSRALLSAVPVADPRSKLNKQRVVLQGDIPTPLNKPSGCGFRTRCPIAKQSCAEEVPLLTEKSMSHFVACPWTE